MLLIKDMSASNGDAKIQELKAKIVNHEFINELELIFLPLMHTIHPRFELVKSAVELVQSIAMDQKQHEKLAASILVLANRFISKEQMEQLWEVIRMYKFIEIAEEKGMQQGIQQGIQQGMQQGMQQGKIQLLTRLLLKRFNNHVPQEYLHKIKALTDDQIDIITLDVFEMRNLDDLKKYLN